MEVQVETELPHNGFISDENGKEEKQVVFIEDEGLETVSVEPVVSLCEASDTFIGSANEEAPLPCNYQKEVEDSEELEKQTVAEAEKSLCQEEKVSSTENIQLENEKNTDKSTTTKSSMLLPQWNQIRATGPLIRISDMHGVESLNYTKMEKRLRCKLAAAYRLLDLFGWSDGVNATVSALTKSKDILVSPVGLMHHEVSASTFVKVALADCNSTAAAAAAAAAVDLDEVTFHSAIYRNRSDVQCIIQFRSPFAAAFSVLKCGLLPLCPEAVELGEITYADYVSSICSQEDELLLGLVTNPNSKVMFLRNSGLVVCGDSVEQAFHLAHNVMDAMETQMNILPLGLSYFHIPSEENQKAISEIASQSPSDVSPSKIDRRIEDVRFEGLMRMLDSAGYQTGYAYRPNWTPKRTMRSQSLMEMAPTGKMSAIDNSPNRKTQAFAYEPSRSNTPSSERSEISRLCKSVIENGYKSSNLRFIPMGTDVNEYKRKVKEIRKDFLPKGHSSGPQSTMLEGLTWDEARRIKESHSGQSGEGIKITAASRGIIQREHQKSAVFFRDYSAANPFDAVSQKEIDNYVQEIQRKTTSPVPPKEFEKQEKEENDMKGQQSTEVTESKSETVSSKLNASEPIGYKSEDRQPVNSILPSETINLTTEGRQCLKVEKDVDLFASVTTVKSEPQAIEPAPSTVKIMPQQSPSISLPVTYAEVKQEEKQKSVEIPAGTEAGAGKNIKPEQSSKDASASKSKLRKAMSVQESDEKKQMPLSPEPTAGRDIEMRKKDKDTSKKKRGLSAIFSKKKKVPTATLR